MSEEVSSDQYVGSLLVPNIIFYARNFGGQHLTCTIVLMKTNIARMSGYVY